MKVLILLLLVSVECSLRLDIARSVSSEVEYCRGKYHTTRCGGRSINDIEDGIRDLVKYNEVSQTDRAFLRVGRELYYSGTKLVSNLELDYGSEVETVPRDFMLHSSCMYYSNSSRVCDYLAHCSNNRILETVGGFRLCYGYTAEHDYGSWSGLRTYTAFRAAGSVINVLKDFYYISDRSSSLGVSVFNGTDLFSVEPLVSDHSSFVVVSVPDYSVYTMKSTMGRGVVPLKFRYNLIYTCNSTLYDMYKVYGGINVFPSRSRCYSSLEGICMDGYTFSDERCPDDMTTAARYKHPVVDFEVAKFTHGTNRDTLIDLGVRFLTDSYSNLTSLVHGFTELSLENSRNMFGLFKSLIENVVSRITKDLKFLSTVAVNVKEQGKIVSAAVNSLAKSFNQTVAFYTDYVLRYLFHNGTHEYDYSGGYRNIISDLFLAVIQPFVDAFESMLRSYWHFVQPLLVDLFKIVLDITVEFLIQFVDLVEKLVKYLESESVVIIGLISKLLMIVLRMVVFIFVSVEREVYLSEIVFFNILIARFISVAYVNVSCTIVFVLIFGLHREYESLLLPFVNGQFGHV